MAEVLCIGEALLVLTPSDETSLRWATTYTSSVAGAECNAAIALAHRGHDVSWSGVLGADPFGDRVLDALAGCGVDTSDVRRTDSAPTGIYFKPPAGGAVVYYRNGSAGALLAPADIMRLSVRRPQIVHITGVTAQASRSGRHALRHVAEERPFGDALVSFDVNRRAALSNPDTPAELGSLAAVSDLVFVGLDEAADLWGTSTAAEVRERFPEPEWLVVKDSDREAVEFHKRSETRVPALAVDVVEATGAGDAFAAGWLSGMLDGGGARERLERGHRSAARVLQSRVDSLIDVVGDACD